MSTRMSIYHEEYGVHIYKELAEPEDDRLRLEYSEGFFLVNIRLSQRLSEIVIAGLDATTKAAVPPEPQFAYPRIDQGEDSVEQDRDRWDASEDRWPR
jgi:hypothetical protein